MSVEHSCTKLCHPTYSANAESLYDEVLHKIDDSILSVKFIKNKHRIESTDDRHATEPTPSILVNCVDKYGKAINVIESSRETITLIYNPK